MAPHHKQTKRVAICIITDENDNILMGKRNDSDKWTNPGGHAEDGEDIYLAAQRELKEETNLDATCIKMVKVHYVKEKNLMVYCFCVKVDPSQEMDTSNDPDKEFSELKYVDINDIKEELHVPLEHNVALKWWANCG